MPKILLVEDDPMISEVYERKLVSAGFDVRKVSTGRGVLDMLRLETVDLVLLDLVLPDMNGLDALESLRDPKNGYDSNIRVVVFSNISESEDRNRAFRLGASDFISKTEFSPSKLIEALPRLLALPVSPPVVSTGDGEASVSGEIESKNPSEETGGVEV